MARTIDQMEGPHRRVFGQRHVSADGQDVEGEPEEQDAEETQQVGRRRDSRDGSTHDHAVGGRSAFEGGDETRDDSADGPQDCRSKSQRDGHRQTAEDEGRDRVAETERVPEARGVAVDGRSTAAEVAADDDSAEEVEELLPPRLVDAEVPFDLSEAVG